MRWSPVVGVALLGCGSADPLGERPEEQAACAPSETRAADGSCEPAGLPADMPCAPGEIVDGAACVPAGVPAARCGAGLAAVDGGCGAVLPDAPCAPGRMALPGETTCRPVAPCSTGRIPVDAETEYVDASFTGTPDGSAGAPWPTIQQAVDAAVSGAVVAIAGGSYAEHVIIEGKSLRLWGSCPDEVEIVGPAEGVAAIDILHGAHGTEVHTLAVRGARVGIGMSNALDIVLDRLWIHDTGDQGLLVDSVLGPASAAMSDSLVESTGLMGMVIVGADLELERTVVRDPAGRGIDAFVSPYSGAVSQVTIADVLVVGAHGGGIVVAGSLAHVERSVVLDTGWDESDKRGWGVAFFDVPGWPPTRAELVDSVVEQSHEAGVIAAGSDVRIEGVTIVDTQPSPLSNGGPGLMVEAWAGTSPQATATVRQSTVARAHTLGVYIGGARGVLVEGLLVRDTLPHDSGFAGWGMSIQAEPDLVQAAEVELRGSVVERTRESGIFVFGSEAHIEATAVRDTFPAANGRFGSALTVVRDPHTALRAFVTARANAFERSVESGVVVLDAELSLIQSVVGATAPNALGTHGDGVLVLSQMDVGRLDLVQSRVEHSGRAAVACFGGLGSIASSALACHSFALDVETYFGKDCELSDLGNNACGCEALTSACKAVSASLEPPPPVSSPFEPPH